VALSFVIGVITDLVIPGSVRISGPAYSLAARECAAAASIWTFRLGQFRRPEPVQFPSSWLVAITISACAGQLMSPLQAQTEEDPRPPASPGADTSSEPTGREALPKCMARWYVDSDITKEEWLQACEHAEADEPSYNVDYARCLA